jgi:hypothetical protein
LLVVEWKSETLVAMLRLTEVWTLRAEETESFPERRKETNSCEQVAEPNFRSEVDAGLVLAEDILMSRCSARRGV